MAAIRAHMILGTQQWTAGTSKAGRAMSGLESVVIMSSVRIAGALGTIGVTASKMYSEIDRDSRRAIALLDKRTERFLDKFISKSREFSTTWGIALDQVVSASYQAFSLGKNFENYTGIMEDAIKATKTYGGTLFDNINLLLKFERVLGLSSEKILDLSAVAIQLGDTKLEYLSQYMGDVVGVTSALKIPTEELFALFSVGTIQLRDTMKVTTGLKALVGQFLSPERGLAKGLQKVYGKPLGEVLKTDNFVTVLRTLEDKMGEAAFSRAVGTNIDAANLALVLKELPDAYNKVLDRMENSQGKFVKDAEFALNSPIQRFEVAIAKLQDVRYTIGGKAVEGLVLFADTLKEVLTKDRAEAFISLADALIKAIPTFAFLAKMLASLGSINIGGYSGFEAVLFASLGMSGARRLGTRVAARRGVASGRSGAQTAATTASTAATGAVLGSAFGPLGTAIGAAIGIAGGLIIDRLGQSNLTADYSDMTQFGDPVNPAQPPGYADIGFTSTQEAENREMQNIIARLSGNTIQDEAKRQLIYSLLYRDVTSGHNPMNLYRPKFAKNIIFKKTQLSETVPGGVSVEAANLSNRLPGASLTTTTPLTSNIAWERDTQGFLIGGHYLEGGKFAANKETGIPDYLGWKPREGQDFYLNQGAGYQLPSGETLDVMSPVTAVPYVFNPETGKLEVGKPVEIIIGEQWDLQRTYWDGVNQQEQEDMNLLAELQAEGNEIASETRDSIREASSRYTRGGYSKWGFVQINQMAEERVW